MHDIEQKLAALKPTRQPELARRILAIPHRRRQRRRDCFVGLAGLLTGIAATVLVMLFQSELFDRPSNHPALSGTPPQEGNYASSPPVEGWHFAQQNDGVVTLREEENKTQKSPVFGDAKHSWTNTEPIDLDEMIARYETMLRHRQEWASKQIAVTPRVVSVSSGGMSRDDLMKEFGG